MDTQYENLLRAYAALPDDTPAEQRWTWLMAAHIVGQPRLRAHWNSHVRMLALAWRTRDHGEVAGQLFRMALVPLGHALGRLPQGNVGRATVNAFVEMEPPEAVKSLMIASRGEPDAAVTLPSSRS